MNICWYADYLIYNPYWRVVWPLQKGYSPQIENNELERYLHPHVALFTLVSLSAHQWQDKKRKNNVYTAED